MYRRMKREEKERIIKFILCSILGLLAGRLLGRPFTTTIPISAILVLYIDRGFTGSLLYCRKRIQTQALTGVIAYIIIFLMRRFLPLDDWVIGILAVVFSILICLPIEYAHSYAPLTVSVGNAVIIMVTGMMVNDRLFLERMIFCIVGATIAIFVNFVVMPQHNRYEETLSKILNNSHTFLNNIDSTAKLEKIKNNINDFPEIEKNLDLIKKDNRWKKSNVPEQELDRLTALAFALKQLIQAQQSWDNCEGVSERFRDNFVRQYINLLSIHEKLLNPTYKLEMKEVKIKEIEAGNESEVQILFSMISYVNELTKLTRLT